jgi:hypothetical protein
MLGWGDAGEAEELMDGQLCCGSRDQHARAPVRQGWAHAVCPKRISAQSFVHAQDGVPVRGPFWRPCLACRSILRNVAD